ncbi:hypothetical protein, partial [Paenibacillus dendritiformis]|uniref:hypothetical protein n=1 Tax=Paenibacillus dendritiformis TaxID=130049 RepID=UPI001BCDAC8E
RLELGNIFPVVEKCKLAQNLVDIKVRNWCACLQAIRHPFEILFTQPFFRLFHPASSLEGPKAP